ncbi:MAG TPA: hypothetical protein DCX89_07175 [Saprospirales bacterium]|nr:hypothetical protein [Saprospirales bacterium]
MNKFYVISSATLMLWSITCNAQTRVNWFTFSKDYNPGTYDVNNKYLGGTDLMYLVNHKGKL